MFLRCLVTTLRSTSKSCAIPSWVSQTSPSCTRTSILSSPASLVKTRKSTVLLRMAFLFFSCSFPRMMMAGYFTQQPLTPRQHILPGCLEIAGVPRVGNIARAVGVVHSLRSSPCTKGVLCYRRACPITQHYVPTGFVQQAVAQFITGISCCELCHILQVSHRVAGGVRGRNFDVGGKVFNKFAAWCNRIMHWTIRTPQALENTYKSV